MVDYTYLNEKYDPKNRPVCATTLASWRVRGQRHDREHDPSGRRSSQGDPLGLGGDCRRQNQSIVSDFELAHPVLFAQTLLVWRMSGDDGLTAIQRIRSRSRTTPKARFGEEVRCKVAKTVRLGKAEARWREGIWLGTIEYSDEHLVGRKREVIQVSSIAGDSDNFDAKAIKEMCGYPLQPHRGGEAEGGGGNDAEEKPAPEAEQDEDPPNERSKYETLYAHRK